MFFLPQRQYILFVTKEWIFVCMWFFPLGTSIKRYCLSLEFSYVIKQDKNGEGKIRSMSISTDVS